MTVRGGYRVQCRDCGYRCYRVPDEDRDRTYGSCPHDGGEMVRVAPRERGQSPGRSRASMTEEPPLVESEGERWRRWVMVTTAASEYWEKAMAAWATSRYSSPEWAGTPEHRQATDQVKQARAWYRHQILSWWWRLLAPLTPGHCVPDEVATLMAEEWDLRGQP